MGEYILTFEEVLFFATILKMKNLFGVNFSKKKQLNYDEIDLDKVKESLVFKNYIDIIDDNHINIEEHIYHIFKIWNKPEKTLVMFGKESDDMNAKQTIFITSNSAIKLINDDFDYSFCLYTNLDEFKLSLKQQLGLHDNLDIDNQLYMIFSSNKFEFLLNLFEEHKILELNDEFVKLGLNPHIGVSLLQLVVKNSLNYLVAIDNKKNKKSIIKTYINNTNQYMFKLVEDKRNQKVVIGNQMSDDFIKSILYL